MTYPPAVITISFPVLSQEPENWDGSVWTQWKECLCVGTIMPSANKSKAI